MELLIDFIYVIGITACIILCFFIFKQNSVTKNRLGTAILLLLLVFINYYAHLHQLRMLYFSTFIFNDCFNVLFGPVIFLYVRSLSNENDSLRKQDLLHFIIPFLYLLFISIPSLLYITKSRFQIAYIEHLFYFIPFLFSYSLFYLIAALKFCLRLQKSVKYYYSNLKNRNINWVKNLLIGGILIISEDLSLSFYELFFGGVNWNIGIITVVLASLFTCYICYKGFSQTSILLPEFLIEETSSPKKENRGTSSIPPKEDNAELIHSLFQLMKREKPFLEEDLTLRNLADKLETSDKRLSQVLNHDLQTTFYDFINSYRIEAFKAALKQDEKTKHLTLFAIASECGFKSKTSFNRIFKNTIGMTPSDYKKTLK